MENWESAKKLDGDALKEFARMLYEYNTREYNAVIAALVRSTDVSDYARLAEMLEVSRTAAEGAWYDGNEHHSAQSVEQKYLRAFTDICRSEGLTEADYMPVLLAAGYADKNSALGRLDKAAEEYIKRRASVNFDAVADLVDRYDKKYIKYRALMAADRKKAIKRLIDKAVYGKHINKAFVRNALMDCGDVAPELFDIYKTANAHDRVAIVRLLLVMKNDARVREFLDETVGNDKSKSVRDLLVERDKKNKGGAPEFFERLMAEGRALSYADWLDILDAEDYAAVADRTFFCIKENGATSVLVYNDGEFLDMSDRAAQLDDGEMIYVLHPVDAPPTLSDVFASGLAQPFLQAARPVFHIMPGEVDRSYRFFGEMISRDEFDKNRKRVGFEACSRRDGKPTVIFRVNENCVCAELDVSQGGTVSCGKLVFCRAADVVRIKRGIYIDSAPVVAVTDVPKREYSELMYAVRRLFRGE